ncbi:MAG: hypothetical protein M0Z36_07695 [Thermaerobacter sp.]|nr:hypothetical protein [Thermaerobacter sp.]
MVRCIPAISKRQYHLARRPLETFDPVVQCIGHTRTRRGGAVQAVLDERTYQKGRKVDDEIFNALNPTRHIFRGVSGPT